MIKLAETAAKGLKRTRGPEHESTLPALGHLARIYEAAGKLHEAIALFERIRDPMIVQARPRPPLTPCPHSTTSPGRTGKPTESPRRLPCSSASATP